METGVELSIMWYNLASPNSLNSSAQFLHGQPQVVLLHGEVLPLGEQRTRLVGVARGAARHVRALHAQRRVAPVQLRYLFLAGWK